MKPFDRFGMALDIACTAIAILFSDRVAKEIVDAQTHSERPITPLDDEFADVFEGRKRNFLQRLVLAAFEDAPKGGPPYTLNYLLVSGRLTLLRKTSIMPSRAIHALAEAIGCDPAQRPRPSVRFHLRAAASVARAIGADERFVRMCWQAAGVDLDEQWHAVRSELLKIRAELGGRP